MHDFTRNPHNTFEDGVRANRSGDLSMRLIYEAPPFMYAAWRNQLHEIRLLPETDPFDER